MARKRKLLRGCRYHVYNRGVARNKVFILPSHWDLFMKRLARYSFDKAEILAYCLMPNHYHLCVEVNCDDFGREVMLPFMTSYTKTLNKELKRVGPIFQGRYQATLISSNEHLQRTIHYIHMNPVRANLVAKATDWQYSSARDFEGV